MVYVPKCQAHNRSECRDPQCPEQRGLRSAYMDAGRNKDYNAYAEVKRIEEARRNSQRQSDGEQKLYHKEIGFPKNFTPPQGVRKLQYSSHAKREAANDRYGSIPLPPQINFEDYSLIEMGVISKDGRSRVEKLLYRGKLDDFRDICIVVIPSAQKNEPWFVKTVWINEANDSHRTLNRKKYVNPFATQKVAA